LNGKRLDDKEINHTKAILEDAEKIAEKRIKKKMAKLAKSTGVKSTGQNR
jgi:hypothetical protein